VEVGEKALKKIFHFFERKKKIKEILPVSTILMVKNSK